MAEMTFTWKRQTVRESSFWQIGVTALNPVGTVQAVAAEGL